MEDTNERERLRMLCEDKEIWMDVKGYEGQYQVSQYGRVRNLLNTHHNLLKDPKQIRPRKTGTTHPYYIVSLCKKNEKHKNGYIHRLVAKGFIANPQKYTFVDHIDGNGLNNFVCNLRWVSPWLNSLNAKRHCTNTSVVKGVFPDKRRNCWRVFWSERNQGNSYRVQKTKRFKTKEEAIEHRKRMVEQHYSLEHYIEDR